jgi:aspartyl-tRNA(Asn)/glutamyl-tRNA(Gln) amidotransferase subunit B
MMTNYETVIGLEVHAQMSTNTKLFCPCSATYGAPANTQSCPVCLGMPGVLPVLNKRAVEFAVKMSLATSCKVNKSSVFARKNYFYPDLPKGYQISQFDKPLSEGGHMDITIGQDGETKRIGITRIHMEDDAGKSIHVEGEPSSLVDLNRAGTPLIEIVSEPDMRSAAEASEYLKAIRDIVVYLGICDGNMQEGSFRCDANISVRPVGQSELGTRTELKNMNSFKFIRDAIEYEVARQIDLIEDGGKVTQETRLFDVKKGITRSMRSKEEAHDYRYFPDPDLLPMLVDESMLSKAKKEMPELPAEKRARFIDVLKLPAYDAGVLTSSRPLADFFESALNELSEADAKTISNWIMGELLRLLKLNNKDITESPITPKAIAVLLTLIKDGKISGNVAKEVFEEMFNTGKDAAAIVKEKGVTQISDEGELEGIIETIIKANQDSVERYKAGKTKLMGFFVGEVMKATKGQANPGVVSKILKTKLV